MEINFHDDSTELCQLLHLFEIFDHKGRHAAYFAFIRYLTTKALPQTWRWLDPMTAHIFNPFSIKIWDKAPSNIRHYHYACVDVKTIIGPAFVNPVYDKNNSVPSPKIPKWSDQFWYLERTFCDRNGWDETQIAANLDALAPSETNYEAHHDFDTEISDLSLSN